MDSKSFNQVVTTLFADSFNQEIVGVMTTIIITWTFKETFQPDF